MIANIISRVKSLYLKYRRPILYMLFGAVTTAVNILCYTLFAEIMGIEELTANALAWVFAVLVAFLTNRTWVFRSHTGSVMGFFRQMVTFYTGRFLSLVMEEAILLVFVKILDFDGMIVKLFAQVVVIVLNYIVSTIFIFKN